MTTPGVEQLAELAELDGVTRVHFDMLARELLAICVLVEDWPEISVLCAQAMSLIDNTIYGQQETTRAIADAEAAARAEPDVKLRAAYEGVVASYRRVLDKYPGDLRRARQFVNLLRSDLGLPAQATDAGRT